MTIRTDSALGRTALAVAHCAGMVDLVALPVWVGVLVAHHRFDPQQAGALVTLFLAGAVAASLYFSSRFHRLRGRVAAPVGFAVAGLAFLAASTQTSFAALGGLHALGGLAAGTALSFTHGTIGRSANPHRLFALVGAALGVFAVVFLGAAPQVVAAAGGPVLFQLFGALMLFAALVTALAFPEPEVESVLSQAFRQSGRRLPPAVWYGVMAIGSMALVQAMTFSFVERMGIDRGFGVDRVTGVLIAMGLVNLLPAVLAALLQQRLPARAVVVGGALMQALLALVISRSEGFAPFAAASAVFVAVMIFTHTFAFGLLARLDVTGRATAATPAMIMVGAALGPVLGGTLVKAVGYGGLGLAALLVDALAVWLFLRMTQPLSPSANEEALA
jgi:predicted MFS family arabinose efflux permease